MRNFVPPAFGAPVVAANGKAYFTRQVRNATYVTGTCDDTVGTYTMTADTYLVELAPQGPGSSLLLAEDSFSGQASSVFHEPARLITGDSYFAPTAPQSQIPATSADLQGPDGQDGVLIGIGRQSSDASQPPELLLVRANASAVRYSVPYPVGIGGKYYCP